MKIGLYEELKILRRCVGRGINENHREGDEINEHVLRTLAMAGGCDGNHGSKGEK
jgi:hypothetical protein